MDEPNTKFTLHGLFLRCPAPFSIQFSSQRIASQPSLNGNHVIALTTPSQAWSRLSSKAKLRLNLGDVTTQKFIETCFINGESIRI